VRVEPTPEENLLDKLKSVPELLAAYNAGRAYQAGKDKEKVEAIRPMCNINSPLILKDEAIVALDEAAGEK
jgi:hypothetical protein